MFREHSNLKGEALANAIREDNLQWDPSVLALIPFPSVLDMMAKDPAWTEQLGNAVLVQRGDVMDAVQRLRKTGAQVWLLADESVLQRRRNRRLCGNHCQ